MSAEKFNLLNFIKDSININMIIHYNIFVTIKHLLHYLM